LRALPEKFEDLERWLLGDRALLAQSTGVPFIRLVYRPDEEADCVRRRGLLRRTLEGRGVKVQTVSCRDVIFAHYERRGRLEQLFQLEATADPELGDNIAGHAAQELTTRLMQAVESLGNDGVIFLTDVAFLYPYLHLGPILDNCTNCIQPPMALAVFYPGEVNLENRLMFLGVRPTSYYRTRHLI
jgi:hypothetical protein